ncbi:hypothetical protein PVL29_021931 [Vitis rotundifolia]|uniref:Uncharacterized protein n=1 Tax=Vitis rotundifolia TaxID=103349 RepID=A0AA38YU53_VITRO|nr:hypothetical protein PVL29_021931 [Vitis rotundifolia]
MENLDSGHLRCEGYGCKETVQRVAQELSHEEPILHERGSLQLAPHHSKALKIQKGLGTKMQCKGYLLGYHSTRDLNEDSNGGSWPLYYGDETLTNGRYYNGSMPRAIADAYTGYDKDVLKHDNA